MDVLFTMMESLLWYDCPQIIRGHDETGCPMLAMHVDDVGKAPAIQQCWVAVKVTQATMDGVLTNKITLRNAFTTDRVGCPYSYTGRDICGKNIVISSITELPEDWLSDEGIYLDYGMFPAPKGEM